MQKRKVKFSVYANFNSNVSTHIDDHPEAVLLMSSNDFRAALAYAEEHEDAHSYIAVVDNREGECYYSSYPALAA